MQKRLGSIVRMSTVVAALGAALVVAVSVSAAASAKPAATCNGTPINVQTINNLSNPVSQLFPEPASALKAVALALTKSCQLGAPVNVNVCDGKYSPNETAACGREAVANKPLVVFTFSGFGDSFIPIVTAAGIPVMPLSSVSSEEVSNPLVFGISSSIGALVGQINLARSTGHKKLALAVLDLPAVNFLVGIASAKAKGLGMTIVKTIPVAVTATDMSGAAGQVIASGADVVIGILPTPQQIGLFQNIRQQGASSKQIAFINTLQNATPKALQALGSAASEKMLLNTWVVDPTETRNPIVKQFVAEMKAAKQPQSNVTQLGITTWAGLHMLADALTAAKLKPSAANVPQALQQKGVFKLSQKYGLNPLTYSQTAFNTDPSLRALRIFSTYQRAYQIVNGKVVPLSDKWLGVLRVQKGLKAQ
jgi:branched-chain amino acid transport system substrate-binding protein